MVVSNQNVIGCFLSFRPFGTMPSNRPYSARQDAPVQAKIRQISKAFFLLCSILSPSSPL
jgi:hypothetical protein